MNRLNLAIKSLILAGLVSTQTNAAAPTDGGNMLQQYRSIPDHCGRTMGELIRFLLTENNTYVMGTGRVHDGGQIAVLAKDDSWSNPSDFVVLMSPPNDPVACINITGTILSAEDPYVGADLSSANRSERCGLRDRFAELMATTGHTHVLAGQILGHSKIVDIYANQQGNWTMTFSQRTVVQMASGARLVRCNIHDTESGHGSWWQFHHRSSRPSALTP